MKCTNSSRLMRPSRLVSIISRTSRAIWSLRSCLTALFDSSIRPYVRIISSASQLPSASKSCSAKKDAASNPLAWCSSAASVSETFAQCDNAIDRTGHVFRHPIRVRIDDGLLRPAAVVSVGEGAPCYPAEYNNREPHVASVRSNMRIPLLAIRELDRSQSSVVGVVVCLSGCQDHHRRNSGRPELRPTETARGLAALQGPGSCDSPEIGWQPLSAVHRTIDLISITTKKLRDRSEGRNNINHQITESVHVHLYFIAMQCRCPMPMSSPGAPITFLLW